MKVNFALSIYTTLQISKIQCCRDRRSQALHFCCIKIIIPFLLKFYFYTHIHAILPTNKS